MWENVEALLSEAECTFDDVAHIIVYLRDNSDYAVVSKLFQERFADKPYIIVQASVCRPNWLIEMECMAVKKTVNAGFEPL
jgi:enamine deaminase RidA (YjgF/YER057c/UK114 family)